MVWPKTVFTDFTTNFIDSTWTVHVRFEYRSSNATIDQQTEGCIVYFQQTSITLQEN